MNSADEDVIVIDSEEEEDKDVQSISSPSQAPTSSSSSFFNSSLAQFPMHSIDEPVVAPARQASSSSLSSTFSSSSARFPVYSVDEPDAPVLRDPTLPDLDHQFKLKPAERGTFLCHVFSAGGGITAKEAGSFRINFEKQRKKSRQGIGTIWQLVEACWQGPGQGRIPSGPLSSGYQESNPLAQDQSSNCGGAVIVLDEGDEEPEGTAALTSSTLGSKAGKQGSSTKVPTCLQAPPVEYLEYANGATTSQDDRTPSSVIPWTAAVRYFQRRLEATRDQARFEKEMVQGSEEHVFACGECRTDSSSCVMECSICGERTEISHGAFCQGSQARSLNEDTSTRNRDSSGSSSSAAGGESHFACCPCWWQYITKTEGALKESLTNVPCIHGSRGCPGGLLGVSDVRRCLGPLDLLVASEREHERSRRVAIGAGCNSIFCTVCRQVVGVVEKKDPLEDYDEAPPSSSQSSGKKKRKSGSGGGSAKRSKVVETVGCPTCGSRYCSECGAPEHGSEPCPPSKELMDFVTKSKNTKRCPNCGIGTTKNGGCNHMTCAASAGGCGYEWCWLCGGKYPKCHCGHFDQRSLQTAMRLQTGGGNRGRFGW